MQLVIRLIKLKGIVQYGTLFFGASRHFPHSLHLDKFATMTDHDERSCSALRVIDETTATTNKGTSYHYAPNEMVPVIDEGRHGDDDSLSAAYQGGGRGRGGQSFQSSSS